MVPNYSTVTDFVHTTEFNSKNSINNNVEEIDPLGDKFNPNFHEALSIKEDKSKQPEEILEVVQKGYKIQERIIRPALVIVNKI